MSDEGVSRREALALAAAGMAVAQLTPGLARAQPGPAGKLTVAEYLAQRLKQQGCHTLFGVPGATCDPMFDAAVAQGLKLAITASDLEAGYAADGYARQRGLGAVCVTYGVGTLSLVNAIAGAYVERSPVVVINGGPTGEDLTRYREEGSLFSHGIGAVPPRKPGATAVAEADLLGDLAVFRRVSVHAVRITRASEAAAMIDEALRIASREQRPVYIEITKALWESEIAAPAGPLAASPPPAAGEEALAQQVLARLRGAQKPVLILGEQISRYGLADAATALVTKLGIPFVTTYLGKAVISEQHPLFAGVYDGPSAPPAVKSRLAEADAILALGCTFGRQYRDLLQKQIGAFMQGADGQFRSGREPSVPASLARLVQALQAAAWTPVPAHAALRPPAGRSFAERRASQPPATGLRAGLPGPGLSYNGLMETISGFLDAGFVVMTDTCLAQYPAADLNLPERKSFVSNAIWNSIGYTPAAALGVGLAERDGAANPAAARRPLVICGDGGFQMTAQALSTLARNRVRAIVIVIDNALYAIEQYVINGSAGYFRDASQPAVAHLNLARWDYVMLAKAMGVQSAQAVASNAELLAALQGFRNAEGPALISAAMNPRSLPSELF